MNRQSRKYVVTPTCEAFTELQMRKVPNEKKPKLRMDTELRNRLSVAFNQMLPGKVAPSMGIIDDIISPW